MVYLVTMTSLPCTYIVKFKHQGVENVPICYTLITVVKFPCALEPYRCFAFDVFSLKRHVIIGACMFFFLFFQVRLMYLNEGIIESVTYCYTAL